MVTWNVCQKSISDFDNKIHRHFFNNLVVQPTHTNSQVILDHPKSLFSIK